MTSHRVDVSSFVLGLLALVLGITAWAGRLGELINHPSAALPLAVGLVGAALIASARRAPEDPTTLEPSDVPPQGPAVEEA
jgi:hypothetical protein